MASLPNPFLANLSKIAKEKETLLCVGLDPALPAQRSKNVMSSDDRLEFMRRIILYVAPYASAVFWFKEEGFDAFTYNPFSGNVLEATKAAHSKGLGIIVLTLMSNPEAVFQKTAVYNEKPLFHHIASLCNEAKSDAVVIGATDNIVSKDVSEVRNILQHEAYVLVPGIGAQGGDAKKILYHFGEKTLVNVGRSIIYSDFPEARAKEFQDKLNNQLKEVKAIKESKSTGSV
ncbi:MAG: orotidine 5'-phosphate decarboxylase / HUMPS family protein [Candidatus Heimdallarchaeaceae archaeon]|jgi:orotidine-5'-phosphate decarboxylase